MRDQCGNFYVPGESLGDLFGDGMTLIPLQNHQPEPTTNMHSAFAPRPVNDEEIQRLKDIGKLVLDESEDHINIKRLYYDKCRESGEPSAYDVVEHLKQKGNTMFVVDTSYIKHTGSVWPPFLNRDIYKGFTNGLNVNEFEEEMKQHFTPLTSAEFEYFQNLKGGVLLNDVPHRFKPYMKSSYIRTWKPPSPQRRSD